MSLKRWIATIFRSHDPALNNLTSGKSFEEKLTDPGVFEYHEEGFTLRFEATVYTREWREIDSMHIYKSDLITIDRIELQIVSGERAFTISEDLPGWYQFLDKAKASLPAMMDDWWSKVTHPAFATNWTTVYDRTWGGAVEEE